MRSHRARKITHRISSVTNGFVQAILPDTIPDPDEQLEVLQILGIKENNLVCAYCGDKAHHWDHLNPYVRNKRPTGFLNNAHNLVPACGPCNTSKSGQDWKAWIIGPAKRSPKTRNINDLENRIARLHSLEQVTCLKPINLSTVVPSELWDSYWSRRNHIEALLIEAQNEAEQIKTHITNALKPAP